MSKTTLNQCPTKWNDYILLAAVSKNHKNNYASLLAITKSLNLYFVISLIDGNCWEGSNVSNKNIESIVDEWINIEPLLDNKTNDIELVCNSCIDSKDQPTPIKLVPVVSPLRVLQIQQLLRWSEPVQAINWDEPDDDNEPEEYLSTHSSSECDYKPLDDFHQCEKCS